MRPNFRSSDALMMFPTTQKPCNPVNTNTLQFYRTTEIPQKRLGTTVLEQTRTQNFSLIKKPNYLMPNINYRQPSS